MVQTLRQRVLSQFVAVIKEFVQIDFLEKHLFIDAEALKIRVGSEMLIQIQEIQHCLFRFCHLINFVFIRKNLIPPKKIRLDGAVSKITKDRRKVIRPFC